MLSDIMTTGVVTIDPDETASKARAVMKRKRIRHLIVTKDGNIAGVLSERDLRGMESKPDRIVSELMTPRVVSAAPEATLEEAANLMSARRIGSLPVIEDGRLAGIVTATDVLDELAREARSDKEDRAERKRAPFTAQLPKALKRVTGRPKAPLIPANIRVAGVKLSDEDREEIRRKLGRKLGKFAESIERVSVRVQDVNGPRGGVDQLCRIKVVLSDLPSVVFESRNSSMRPAISSALGGVERAVRKTLQRSNQNRASKPDDVE